MKPRIDELKDLIRTHLNECDRTNLPTICDIKETKQGYDKLESQIIDRIGQQGITIAEALIQIEKEYNSNMQGID